MNDSIEHPLSTACGPSWASAWGEDRFGLWAELTIDKVVTRLRWIRPGRFLFGVSKTEEAFSWEIIGQRRERVELGFWMFEAPCTQGLWEIIMGKNPSRFKGKSRPVESISWNDCRTFLEKVNGRNNGLNLTLPSEVQWEYACRAGTRGPRYHADITEIAWFSENSDQQTHPVKGKKANAWGLYDMLGNVLEWCEDKWDVKDDDVSAPRVIRGGGWANESRDLRAAYRCANHPDNAYGNLGFRCSSSGVSPDGDG